MDGRCEIPKGGPPDEEIRAILDEARTIAVVGLSNDPARPSHRIASLLKAAGYRVIPVNPRLQSCLGETAYGRLEEIPDAVDIVDIFRRAEAVPEIVDAAIRIEAKAVWMQEGIVHAAAAESARAAGLTVVESRCIWKELRRLLAGPTSPGRFQVR